MAKKAVLINAQDISKIVVSTTFEFDVMDNLDQTMARVRELLELIMEKADNFEADAVDMAIEAAISESKKSGK